MTPEQALEIIKQVQQQFAATGKDHDTIRQAVAVLAEAIRPKG